MTESFALRTRDGPPAPPGAPFLTMLATAALVLTGGAVYVSAVSDHAPQPASHAALTTLVCLTFVGAGLCALTQRPYVRFGWLLAAVGVTSLLGALHDANDALLYTVGVLTSNLVFAVLAESLLGFPRGVLHTRRLRTVVAVAYADVLLLQVVAVLFDPLTRWHSDHPRNVVLIAAHPALATVLEEVEAAIAVGVAAATVAEIRGRARTATPAARRQLGSVLWAGEIALVTFAVGLVLAPISSNAAVVGIGLGMLLALALPIAFMHMLLKARLSKAAVGELLLELRRPGDAPGLEDALRRALGDPTLALGRTGDDGAYVDGDGCALLLPAPGEPRVTTPILHQGEPIGALVHDRALRLRPALVDAVAAAAGFALANERALEAVRLVERRNRALLDAIPDPMIRVARDGTYLDVRADDTSGLVRPPDELVGLNVRDVLPRPLADDVMRWIDRTLARGKVTAFEYEIEIAGKRRWKESRMTPSGPDEAVTIIRDFTEQRRAERGRRRLAAEQAALRRVATLVAGNAPPERVFQSVTEEVCRLLDLRTAVLHRFEDMRTSTIVGKFGGLTGPFELGNVVELEVGSALQVLETGAPARSDYDVLPGEGARELRALGFRGSVGVPITVSGATWGALVVALREDETLPLATEHRLLAFAELVGLAVASAHARDELAASRRRIVEASDTERRRLERNLHDGAQQRLVALSLGLRLVRAKLQSSPGEASRLLDIFADELGEALTELRELAQGLHPAVLTERGLGAALEVLAARAPLPVEVETSVPERLPEAIETAAYYAASEALANVVKHAEARSARIWADCREGHLVVEIADDGVGGADMDHGSGLFGLRDRVETLGGSLSIDSPPGRGTVVRSELPVRSPSLVSFEQGAA